MKFPRDLSGNDLANALCRHWGYRRVHQAGSHIVIQSPEPAAHRISVPAHKYLRIGTLNGILRAVAENKGATREEILKSVG